MSTCNFLTTLVLMATQLSLIESQSTVSTDSKPNLYKKLCYDPTEWTSKTASLRSDHGSTKERWVVHFGDVVTRFHFGSLLKGATLKLEDNDEDMCLTITKEYTLNETTDIGYFHGFGRQRATNWNCKPSLDFSGVNRCNLHSAYPSQYHDELYFYFTDTKKKDVNVSVHCFSNGDIGWHAFSNKATLTDEETQAVRNQVASLGFSTTDFPNTALRMYGSSCNSTREINSVSGN